MEGRDFGSHNNAGCDHAVAGAGSLAGAGLGMPGVPQRLTWLTPGRFMAKIRVPSDQRNEQTVKHLPETGDQTSGSSQTRPAGFPTTHWSGVLATAATETTHAREALGRLCSAYWFPLYAYVRRRGNSPQDAEDLTQGFFARLLEKKTLDHLTPEQGRFRSFLLKSLNHFLTDEWRRARAQKRGGGQVVSLDAATAETRYGLELADPLTPELLYDRLWALTLLASVFRSLQDEYGRDGKADLFRELKFCLTGNRSAIPYTDLAQRLGVPPNTVKTWVHRLRQRYRQLLREEVGRTLASPDDIEPELQCLFKALG